jgi:hypothetical protein
MRDLGGESGAKEISFALLHHFLLWAEKPVIYAALTLAPGIKSILFLNLKKSFQMNLLAAISYHMWPVNTYVIRLIETIVKFTRWSDEVASHKTIVQRANLFRCGRVTWNFFYELLYRQPVTRDRHPAVRSKTGTNWQKLYRTIFNF